MERANRAHEDLRGALVREVRRTGRGTAKDPGKCPQRRGGGRGGGQSRSVSRGSRSCRRWVGAPRARARESASDRRALAADYGRTCASPREPVDPAEVAGIVAEAVSSSGTAGRSSSRAARRRAAPSSAALEHLRDSWAAEDAARRQVDCDSKRPTTSARQRGRGARRRRPVACGVIVAN